MVVTSVLVVVVFVMVAFNHGEFLSVGVMLCEAFTLGLGSAVTCLSYRGHYRPFINLAVSGDTQAASLGAHLDTGHTWDLGYRVADRTLATTAAHTPHVILTCVHNRAPFTIAFLERLYPHRVYFKG